MPLGVWLSAGTCLAGVTVIAIAARLRSRRRNGTAPAIKSALDEPLTGRLSDLEAVIENEARKLTEQAGVTGPDATDAVVAIDAEREPIELTDLAGNGVGLLGPGQRGAALAAILTATTGNISVLLTQSAITRLSLDGSGSTRIRVFEDLPEALDADSFEDAVLLVCTDTDIDEPARASFERFLAVGDRGAVVLGDWEASSVTLTGTGTVRDATGIAAQHPPTAVHIADPQTAVAILTELDKPEPGPDETENAPPEPMAPAVDEASNDTSEFEPPADSVETTTEPRPRLCLFGQPDVYLDQQAIPLKKGRRSRAFLTVLACADEPVGRDELLEGVVGDMVEMDRAKNNFSATAIDTRRALREATGDPVAEFYTYDRATETYELERDRFTIDIDEFNDAEQSAALASDPIETARHLEAAIALYTGDLAPEVDTDTVGRLRDLYRTKAVKILDRLADHCAMHGDSAGAEHHRSRAAQIGPAE
ncbi:hypothetical protein GCM10029992_36070 [Glycomyces albus]